jgi:hypothetical protein
MRMFSSRPTSLLMVYTSRRAWKKEGKDQGLQDIKACLPVSLGLRTYSASYGSCAHRY